MACSRRLADDAYREVGRLLLFYLKRWMKDTISSRRHGAGTSGWIFLGSRVKAPRPTGVKAPVGSERSKTVSLEKGKQSYPILSML
jgi:hypothetical protein